MKRLPKAKRDQVILTGVGTVVLLAVIVFGLIRPQYAATSDINGRITAERSHLQSMDDSIKQANVIAGQLTNLTATLNQAESDLSSGDPAQWIYNTIRNFQTRYQVDVSLNSQLSVGPVDLLPNFPYKQLKVSVAGTAYYHDLGKFIADFENAFPHARITNLNLNPAGDNTEKLAFRMEIIALVNPDGPQS